MRVARPAWLSRSNLIIAVLALAIVGGLFAYKEIKKPPANETNAQSNIRIYKQFKDANTMRVVAASYEQDNQFEQAEQEWKDIIKQTNQTGDYISLLNICANHPVSDKADCVNNAAATLKQRTDKMDFGTAYSVGAVLESNKFNKLAVPFYQRALAVYTPSPPGVYFPSKDQLQAKINELNK
jgi:hypothetical protein